MISLGLGLIIAGIVSVIVIFGYESKFMKPFIEIIKGEDDEFID